MFLKLLLPVPLFLFAAQVQQPGSGSSAATPAAPPIKMGLWEATMTMGTTGATYKSHACLSPESYQRMLTRVPPNCTISNLATTATSITGDVKCESPDGGTSKGHVDVQIPDASTVHGTVTVTTKYQGHTVSMDIKSDGHFIGADCGDLSPGETREVE